MPTNKPNSISSLRGRFDPHYKLAGKVEGLEKGVSNQVSQIHKTISKSFVTQRKTLARVLGLEKRVNHLEIQEAAEEQAKENLDDILKGINFLRLSNNPININKEKIIKIMNSK